MSLKSAVCVIVLLLVARGAAAQTEFTVTNEPAGPPLVGFGAEMNPYLYCTPNWADVESRVADYEAKVLALRPQHVRMFYRQEWFEAGRTTSPRTTRAWPSRSCGSASWPSAPGRRSTSRRGRGHGRSRKSRWRRSRATVDDLVRKQKLAAIRYITIQNEPNTTKMSFETYNRLYRALDAELKKRGLREQIKIISGDLVQDNQRIGSPTSGRISRTFRTAIRFTSTGTTGTPQNSCGGSARYRRSSPRFRRRSSGRCT
jgi:hypothetical protein